MTSSIRDQGEQERERYAREERQRKERRGREARSLVESWFYSDFYDHHFVPNPEYNAGVFAPKSNPRRVIDPARPLPPIERFELIAPDAHADASFVCEGIRYVCRWEYHPGGDRAFWDDGWWPQWSVVVPRWLGRFGRREVRVHGPATVAEAVA